MYYPVNVPLSEQLSPWFIFHFARELTGRTIRGSTLLACNRVLKGKGVCPLLMWPQPDFITCDIDTILRAALPYRIPFYQRPDSLNDMIDVLEKGLPFNLSFDMYESFKFAEQFNGVVPMPATNDEWIDAHAVLVTEVLAAQAFSYNGQFDPQLGFFKADMGWKRTWGDDGYGYIPFEYVKEHGKESFVSLPSSVQFVNRNTYKIFDRASGDTKLHLAITGWPSALKNAAIWVFDAFDTHGKLVGWCIVEDKIDRQDKSKNRGLAEIVDLFVQPEERLNGYGAIILDYVQQHAKSGNILLFYGWIPNDDTEQEGLLPSTQFFRKRGFSLIECRDVNAWSKALLYKNI